MSKKCLERLVSLSEMRYVFDLPFLSMNGTNETSFSRDMDIFGVGNSLVDIVAHVDDEFLKTYNLAKNSSILADIQHEGLYDDVMNKYDIEYSAGGSVQNALRYCQWVVGKNNSVANFVGAVGDDYFGRILEKKVKMDGLNVKYHVSDEKSTGVCAVLFTDGGKYKTICTNLGASNLLDKHFVMSNFWFCERARLILTSGHLIPISPDSVMCLAHHAQEWGKDFVFSIGAPYVVQKCSNFLIEVFPFIDFLFCNANEALTFATMKGYYSKDLKTIAKMMADEPKTSYNNPRIPNHFKATRIVIVTQGERPVIMADSSTQEIKEYPVPQFKEDEIKDTDGAGDAFIGGFLAMYIDGHKLDTCVSCGIYCAAESLQQPGTTLPKQMNFQP